jgi:RNA recognition motif-containing protein
MNIYVGNLSFDATEDDVRGLFTEFGEVTSVNIISDRDSGRPKGFGFVEMAQAEQAQNAMKSLNGKEFKGRALNVNEARPKTDRPRRQQRW